MNRVDGQPFIFSGGTTIVPFTIWSPKLCPAMKGYPQWVAWRPIVQISVGTNPMWYDVDIRGAASPYTSVWKKATWDYYGECVAPVFQNSQVYLPMPTNFRGDIRIRVGYYAYWYWNANDTRYDRLINRSAYLYLGSKSAGYDPYFTVSFR